ncbi:MAG: hypothetical protein KZQ99_06490 [Candidatus Thiodiazotropha sp. (ex Dulcina madagascariensis)]|nr:hypothetical protein [Candidatus Thiodiazotropha sp. (ex Dulcina madagascariensis)]
MRDKTVSLALIANKPTHLIITDDGHSTILPATMIDDVDGKKRLLVNTAQLEGIISLNKQWFRDSPNEVLACLHETPSFTSIKRIEAA